MPGLDLSQFGTFQQPESDTQPEVREGQTALLSEPLATSQFQIFSIASTLDVLGDGHGQYGDDHKGHSDLA